MPKRQLGIRQSAQSIVNLPVNRQLTVNRDMIDGTIENEIDESEIERPKRKKNKSVRGRPVKEAPFSLPEPLDEADEERLVNSANKSIGQAIRLVRTEKGLTLKMVYESAGLDRAYYGNLELGKTGVSIANLAKIARAMRTTLKGLVEKIED